MKFDPRKGGSHLACVRNWIQRKAVNGEYVTWGSNEILQMRINITPKVLEDLTCDIAEAVLRDAWYALKQALEKNTNDFVETIEHESKLEPWRSKPWRNR